MVVGEIIAVLESVPREQVVAIGFGNPHSYRGYYEDLAFEPSYGTTVGAMLNAAKEAQGSTYVAWKGGEYQMGKFTNCWLSKEGESSGETIGETLLSFMLGFNGDTTSIVEAIKGFYDSESRLR